MTTKKILVVDNEEYIQEVTKICLQTTANWQVITANLSMQEEARKGNVEFRM